MGKIWVHIELNAFLKFILKRVRTLLAFEPDRKIISGRNMFKLPRHLIAAKSRTKQNKVFKFAYPPYATAFYNLLFAFLSECDDMLFQGL